ncbi:MAG: ABC transporter permease, partial [Parabacteroides sp.]|nr:ABC transporter permease [Parabacteroides sp.]
MILVILFVVYGLIFTGIIIQNSVKSSKDYVRKELGAIVEMRANFGKAMEQKLSREEFSKLNLSASLAKEIAKDPAVKELYITEMTGASNSELKSAVNTGGGEDVGVAVVAATAGPVGSFFVMGSNTDTPLEFSDETLQISEGRLRTADDQGKDTLLISEEFASKNNLSVGDFIDLTADADKQSYSFEIIGIYKGAPSMMVDQMFTSLESAKKLAGTVGDENNASYIGFLLKDPMDIDNFIKLHESQMPNEFIELYASDDEYQALTRPLELISTILSILLVVVLIAGVTIMLAIITIFVRDRKFEIGLLLASGEGRLNILSQFVLEILIVSVLAFLIA